MEITGIENTLYASSQLSTVTNVIPSPGDTTPRYWTPSDADNSREIRLGLPILYGLRPEEYDLFSVNVVANNFYNVTLTVTNSDGDVEFTVSTLGFVTLSFVGVKLRCKT